PSIDSIKSAFRKNGSPLRRWTTINLHLRVLQFANGWQVGRSGLRLRLRTQRIPATTPIQLTGGLAGSPGSDSTGPSAVSVGSAGPSTGSVSALFPSPGSGVGAVSAVVSAGPALASI